MSRTLDFHSHTRYSDGVSTPAELHARMRRRGVEIYAVTDHDTLAAHAVPCEDNPAADEAERPEPRRVVGVELNTVHRGNEVHVLGYGFALDDPTMGAALAANRRARVERAEESVARLVAAGVPLTIEEVFAAADGAEAIGRPHLARALVARGYVDTVRAAMRRFLGRGEAGYVASRAMTPFEAIDVVHAAGGMAVLAHPGRLDDLDLIDEMAAAGVDGLEVYYPRHTEPQTARFVADADRLGLLRTAGSDFHDPVHNPRGVGMAVDAAAIAPFLERLDP